MVQCGKNSTVKKRDLGNKSVNVMVFFQNLHFGLAGRGQKVNKINVTIAQKKNSGWVGV